MTENRPSDGASILLVAGEASGDLHGGPLCEAILRRRPDCRLFGLGGDRMLQAGMEVLQHVERLGVTGLTEVVGRFAEIRAAFHGILEQVHRRSPDLAVLIDYPGFNLRLATRLRRLGIPVVYYVSPQIWAWRTGRIRRIRRDVRRMLVILPFEEAFYRERGVEAEFVGHPLMDGARPIPGSETRQGPPRILLLPGSRRNEIRRILPVMAGAVQILDAERELRFELLRAPTLEEGLLVEQLGPVADRVTIWCGDPAEILPGASAAMVCSGTATLETALAGVPMVVAYRFSALSFLVARSLVKIPHAALVNIVAGREVVPELLQENLTAPSLASEIGAYLDDAERTARVRRDLAEVARMMGEPGAADRAAARVVELLPPAQRNGTPGKV